MANLRTYFIRACRGHLAKAGALPSCDAALAASNERSVMEQAMETTTADELVETAIEGKIDRFTRRLDHTIPDVD